MRILLVILGGLSLLLIGQMSIVYYNQNNEAFVTSLIAFFWCFSNLLKEIDNLKND